MHHTYSIRASRSACFMICFSLADATSTENNQILQLLLSSDDVLISFFG